MPIAAIAGPVLGLAGSVAGGLIGAHTADENRAAAQQAAQQANAGLQGVQNQTQQNLQPFVGYGQNESGALAGLLGVGGNPQASADAFNNFRNSTNYDFMLNQGLNAVKTAGAGSFNSGATAKALNNYAQGQAGNALGNYEQLLMGGANQGIQAGSNLGQLGNQNLNAQGQNLLAGAGATIGANNQQMGSTLGALQGGITSLGQLGSSFGSGGALSGLFGGGPSQSSFGNVGSANVGSGMFQGQGGGWGGTLFGMNSNPGTGTNPFGLSSLAGLSG